MKTTATMVLLLGSTLLSQAEIRFGQSPPPQAMPIVAHRQVAWFTNQGGVTVIHHWGEHTGYRSFNMGSGTATLFGFIGPNHLLVGGG